MRVLNILAVLTVVVGYCFALTNTTTEATRYVFDMYKNAPALDSEAVADLMAVAQPGTTFPLNDKVPDTGFDCGSQATPGYFADPAPPSLCQAFYRCEPSGNQTGFLCPNQTLFNQLTLTCDYYWNVDCAGSKNLYNFANSRLYKPQPLFDTPPKGYITLLSGVQSQDGVPLPQLAAKEAAARSDNSATVARAAAAITPISVVPVPPAPVLQPASMVLVPVKPSAALAATTKAPTTRKKSPSSAATAAATAVIATLVPVVSVRGSTGTNQSAGLQGSAAAIRSKAQLGATTVSSVVIANVAVVTDASTATDSITMLVLQTDASTTVTVTDATSVAAVVVGDDVTATAIGPDGRSADGAGTGPSTGLVILPVGQTSAVVNVSGPAGSLTSGSTAVGNATGMTDSKVIVADSGVTTTVSTLVATDAGVPIADVSNVTDASTVDATDASTVASTVASSASSTVTETVAAAGGAVAGNGMGLVILPVGQTSAMINVSGPAGSLASGFAAAGNATGATESTVVVADSGVSTSVAAVAVTGASATAAAPVATGAVVPVVIAPNVAVARVAPASKVTIVVKPGVQG